MLAAIVASSSFSLIFLETDGSVGGVTVTGMVSFSPLWSFLSVKLKVAVFGIFERVTPSLILAGMTNSTSWPAKAPALAKSFIVAVTVCPSTVTSKKLAAAPWMTGLLSVSFTTDKSLSNLSVMTNFL